MKTLQWHLGMHETRYYPSSRGFDHHEGYFQGCGSYATHIAACCAAPTPNASDIENFVCGPGGGEGSSAKDYRGLDWFSGYTPTGADPHINGTVSSEIIAARAEAFIMNASSSPFFLYLPFQNIHAPYDAKWDSVQRFADLPISPQQKQIYGYLYELDVAVGRVVSALKAAGLLEDTVVIGVSDNGAPSAPGVLDRNYPLSGFKGTVYEGGTRVPAFINAPGRVPPGTVVDKLVHVTDWVPTLLSLMGGKASEDLDGLDVWPSIVSGQTVRQEVVVNINPLCTGGQFSAPKAAIRIGDMKLLCFCYSVTGIAGASETGCIGDPSNPGEWPQLYNLTGDIGESHNLAKLLPATVRDLESRLAVLASRMVEPMQWTPPFQGPDYYCANCSLRNSTGPYLPWDAWL